MSTITLTEAQTLWVQSLRSGHYGQATNVLECVDTGSFCCLGVACQLFAPENRQVRGNRIFYGTYDPELEIDEIDDTEAPKSVQHRLGLRAADGALATEHLPEDLVAEMRKTFPNGQISLAGLNDLGWTFEQIADLVETHPQAVFK